jgi:hypothetical protein
LAELFLRWEEWVVVEMEPLLFLWTIMSRVLTTQTRQIVNRPLFKALAGSVFGATNAMGTDVESSSLLERHVLSTLRTIPEEIQLDVLSTSWSEIWTSAPFSTLTKTALARIGSSMVDAAIQSSSVVTT